MQNVNTEEDETIGCLFNSELIVASLCCRPTWENSSRVPRRCVCWSPGHAVRHRLPDTLPSGLPLWQQQRPSESPKGQTSPSPAPLSPPSAHRRQPRQPQCCGCGLWSDWEHWGLWARGLGWYVWPVGTATQALRESSVERHHVHIFWGYLSQKHFLMVFYSLL